MPRSWKSSDYICPGCRNWNLGHNMRCATCNHHKPTLNTMGERAHDFYPLASQKMHCQGSKNCPECHAIVHISHSECMACRDRRKNEAVIKAHQACVITTATGNKDAERSDRLHALKGPDDFLALPAPSRPRSAVDELVDKYKGVDALAIIDDLEKIKTGSNLPTIEQMKAQIEEKKRIAEEEEREKERERERTRQRQEAEEKAKKDLEVAKQDAINMEAERKRKREAGQDMIAKMLAEDEAAQVQAAAPASSAPKADAEDEGRRQERKTELLRQAEELRKKQEEMKRKKEVDEEERRKRMRERRAQRNASKESPKDTTVVLDD